MCPAWLRHGECMRALPELLLVPPARHLRAQVVSVGRHSQLRVQLLRLLLPCFAPSAGSERACVESPAGRGGVTRGRDGRSGHGFALDASVVGRPRWARA